MLVTEVQKEAIELGADAVKTDPLNDLEDYYKITNLPRESQYCCVAAHECRTMNCFPALMR